MTSSTVLVIDDEEDVRRLIARELRREGFHVVEAGDGHEGLIKAGEHSPNVIVLDLVMPGMNGLEFLARLRLEGRDDCAVVVVSGSLDDDVAKACLAAGVNETIHKPFQLADLSESVRKAAVAAP